jgi:FKBP-type peptidyl-prolyl cis-trans isomerase (trigger factor)
MRVRDDLALEALARAVGIEIADDEVESEVARLAEAQKTSAAKLRERLVASGALALVREDLTQRKAMRWLMENVEVVDGDPEAAEAPAKPAKSAKAGKAAKAPATKTAKPKKAAAKKE